MIYGLLFAIWRRVYGEGSIKGLLGNRAFQSFLCIVLLMSVFATILTTWEIWLTVFIIATWVTIQYWSRAVGEIIDAGLNNQQNADSYDRWFRIPLDWIYDKLGKQKYVGAYDFWYSCIRYGIGAAPLCHYSWWALALIPLHYPIYLFCHKLYNKFPKMYQLKYNLNEPKNLAELIHGFIFGLIISLIKVSL